MKEFTYETFMNKRFHYQIMAHGIEYLSPEGETINVNWEDIGGISKDFSNKLVVNDTQGRKLFPIDVGYFDYDSSVLELLDVICTKLGLMHAKELSQSRFTKNGMFFVSQTVFFIITLLIVFLSIELLHIAMLPLIAVVPVLIWYMLKPFQIKVLKKSIQIRNVLGAKELSYNQIHSIEFTYLNKRRLYESLGMLVTLKNKKTIKLGNFKDLLLFFITFKSNFLRSRNSTQTQVQVCTLTTRRNL